MQQQQPQMMAMQPQMMQGQVMAGQVMQPMAAYHQQPQTQMSQMQYQQYAQPMQQMQPMQNMGQYMPPPQMQPMQAQPMQNSGVNIQDPEVQKARVFVGNLNTQMLSRDELHKVFSKYGQVVSVSMHKGFAFVQFPDEWTARNAVRGEDEKNYYGNRIDVNIASEPKPRRNHSRSNRGDRDGGERRRGRDNDRDRDDYGGPSPAKRSRDDDSMGRGPPKDRLGPRVQNSNMNLTQSDLEAINTPSSKSIGAIREKLVRDYLVCGNCKESFEHIERLTSHKQAGCRVRFVCRCKQGGEPRTLDCAYCGKQFLSSWELICHCQKDHDLTVYSSCVPPRPDGEEEDAKSADSKDQSRDDDNGDGDVEPENDIAEEAEAESQGDAEADQSDKD